jgi:D-alanyl-D-alanine carboxypeptidase
MQLASVSKAFSGATAVVVVKDRKLKLDDTIGKRLPTVPQAWGANACGFPPPCRSTRG